MNGVEQTTLPNEFFFIRYGIPRQRKADALLKLKAAGLVVVHKELGKAGLVVVHKELGKAALVKLNIEEDYGKENK
jgi:hypothetical protein|tara:strand:- start:27 stop:254 length:228 start_codon:yes stop_codon:yes gene_type:complete